MKYNSIHFVGNFENMYIHIEEKELLPVLELELDYIIYV